MKKFFASFLSIIIIIASCITAYSASNISFSLSNASARKGRLVSIDMSASFDNYLCAALFEFTFDDSVLEFRDIKCENDNSKIETNCVGNKVKAIFLNEFGDDVSSRNVIFTITFKAVDYGTSYIDYTVSDCIDADVKSINVGSCTSGKISVTGSSDNNSDSKNTDTETKSKDKNSSKSKRIDDEEDETADIVNLGEVNPFKIDKASYVFAGISIGLLLSIFVYVVYLFGKNSAKHNDKSDKQDNKSNNEKCDDGNDEDFSNEIIR